MAEKVGPPERQSQHEENAIEEAMGRIDTLNGDTHGLEEPKRASSNHSHSSNKTIRPQEDEGDCENPLQTHDSPQVFRCWHESSQTSEVEDFIYAQPSASGPQLYRPENADCGAWMSPSNPKCPASFGTRGTTATAGAFGQLVQFSNFLGAGNSGMFSAGHCWTDKPYWVTRRARDLQDLAAETFEEGQVQDHDNVFGLKFLNLQLLDDAPVKLKWYQYRWPCYEFKRECFEGLDNVGMTIQFIVRDGTVLQQCILENWGEADVDIHFAFCTAMCISDLDHVTDNYAFNKITPDDQNAGPGPGGFGWVHLNRFHEGASGTRTDSPCSSHRESDRSHYNRINKSQPSHGVALVISVAVDGEMIRFSQGQSSHIWKKVLKARSNTPEGRSHELEIVTAYKLILVADPRSDWKKFIVPLEEMDANRFLREARAFSSFPTSITRTNGRHGSACSDVAPHSETLVSDVKKYEADIANVPQDGVATAPDSGQETEQSPAVDHEPTPKEADSITDHIEFTVRRNLEHILSVCAIPVGASGERDKGLIDKLRDVQPIALTCGDMSGHRISTASSFFAFQFLAEVAKRLSRLPQPQRDDFFIQHLLRRIRYVCLGHLKWLRAAEKSRPNGEFMSLYWATGEAVTQPKSSKTWVPRQHVRNTAFHILKAIEFMNSFSDDDNGDFSVVCEIVGQWGQGWVRLLEKLDKRGSLTWHRKESEGVKVFRLDDHVWIWRALKAMEDKRLGPWMNLYHRAQQDNGSSSTDLRAINADQMSRRIQRFSSRNFQQKVLRNFTTEHEILRRQMVALTRSPRETRFFFHGRDTALLYGQDMGFPLEDLSFREAWKNTIDAQCLHEGSQEHRWDSALRYALSIMLGVRRHQINYREPGDMVKTATEVLLQSSSGNGLFPGKLDIMTKGPLTDAFHEERDANSSYDAGFEIPYIFLTHTKEIRAVIDHCPDMILRTGQGEINLDDHPTGESENSPTAIPAHPRKNLQVQVGPREENKELQVLLVRLSDVLSALPRLPNTISASNGIRSKGLAVNALFNLKKAIPFSNIIDSHSIVEIEDEWLFNYPQFFGFEEDAKTSIDETLGPSEDFEATWLRTIDVSEMRRKYSSHNQEDSIAEDHSQASTNYSSTTSTESSISFGGTGDSGLGVLDSFSRKHLQGKGAANLFEGRAISVNMGSFEDVWENVLSRPRTVAKAKKRAILLVHKGTDRGPEAALLCYAATKGDERMNMFEFFQRHFRHEKVMFDHCSLVYNTWETEVHMSFFILRDKSEPLSGDTAQHVEGFPGVQGKHIFRGSMGFRFHGDAFDRYWTLHLFANLDLPTLNAKQDVSVRLATDERLFPKLFQRKIAELRLFAAMLSQAAFHTEQILTEVKSELGIKSGAFSWSIPSMDRYSSWSTLWEGFAPLVQALADDLISTKDMICQWEAREISRGQDRPRWTHSDERKHRADITRHQRLLDWRKREIQNVLNDVESLRELCTARLANAREELSFRSSQNIASFTYVTIVFLPLGFAASVFSMNGYPSTDWVASMVVIAVVTLAVTVVALANAKMLLGAAEQFGKDAMKLTGNVFKSSLMGQQKRQRDEQARDSSVPDKPARGNEVGGEPLQGHVTRQVMFWVVYLLIELPARRVALACRALSTPLIQSLDISPSDATPPAAAAAIGREVIRITGGILVLPLLLTSWTIQLLFYNVLDVLTLLGRLALRTFNALVAPRNANGVASDTKVVTWLIEPPPWLRPVRKLMTHEKSGKTAPQTDVLVNTDRESSGPAQEA
ncbi:hypothetical protein N8I77_005403 [Diaporthe amygdali]|uniref:Uncharacterized protein n=1 Tax=Phomopsis amygdali TaxID=1214568 RepID=A0AAD9W3C7_PHOAM|nr:hypothetical protein N8I77_005403 [Diaporthe amygdali]